MPQQTVLQPVTCRLQRGHLSLAFISMEVIHITCTQRESVTLDSKLKAKRNKNRGAAGRQGSISRPSEVLFPYRYAATISKSACNSDLLEVFFAEAKLSQSCIIPNSCHHLHPRGVGKFCCS